ncbi:MAG TPA: hypothetical protein VNM43_08270 [Dehalococcoidia bacterium]|nr:hypothetical protein [Dehalococcoidia bacterium]
MRSALALCAILAALVALGAACGGGGDGSPSPVRGVVVDVEGSAFGDVPAFTIRTDDGHTMRFRLALEDEFAFPPEHLRAHMATLEPVRVWYREEGGERVAYRVEDAPR